MASFITLTREDSSQLYALIHEIESFDDIEVRTTLDEVTSYFDDSHYFVIDGVLKDGKLIGFGMARALRGEAEPLTVTMSGGVHPDYRRDGLGGQIIDRQLVASERIADATGMTVHRIIAYTDATNTAFESLLKAREFTFESSFAQLRRKVADLGPIRFQSERLKIVELKDHLRGEARREHNHVLACRETWSTQSAVTWDAKLARMQWKVGVIDTYGDRPRLVGYMLASTSTSGLDGANHDEGYIEEIVVSKAWRGQHIGSILVRYAASAFADARLTYMGLDLDEASPGSETLRGIFERSGFHVIARTNVWTATRKA